MSHANGGRDDKQSLIPAGKTTPNGQADLFADTEDYERKIQVHKKQHSDSKANPTPRRTSRSGTEEREAELPQDIASCQRDDDGTDTRELSFHRIGASHFASLGV